MKYMPLAGLLVDIGTGAGFPGIPLKIMNPGLSVVLVEAVRKKASFLKQIIRLLKLQGIEVYNGRVEDFDGNGVFDFAVSRAFSELGLFCRLAARFIKPGGMLLAMKGNDKKELAAALETPPCGFTCAALHTYELPRHKGKRSLVVLQNVSRETFMAGV
jgi:16S rRNA (guanine527-N7)-methyltransferase